MLQFIFTTIVYYRISRSFPKDSDNAVVVLEAQDIVDGNILLSGWILPGDNFYTLDIIPYIIFLKFRVPWRTAIDLVPAFIFYFFSMIVILLSFRYTNNYFLSLMYFYSLIGFSSSRFLRVLLYSPSHILSLAISLITLYIISTLFEEGIQSKILLFFSFIITIWINLGDPLTLFFVNYPVILYSFYSFVRHKHKYRGRFKYIIILIIMIMAILVSKKLLKVIEVSGGFKTLPISHKFGDVKYALKSIILYVVSLLDTLNVHVDIYLDVLHYNIPVYVPVTLRFLFSLSRIAFISYIFYNIIAQLKNRYVKEKASFSILPLSIISFLMLTLAFILSGSPKNILSARFFVIFPVSILIALSLIRPVEKRRIKIPLLVFNLIFMFETAFYFFAPPWKYGREKALLRFLEDKHLTTGIAPYWDSYILTVLSDGKIKVRSVKACGKQRIKPDDFLSNSIWYRMEQFSFALCSSANDDCNDFYKRFINTLGKPDEIDTMHDYFVFIYKKHPIRFNDPINCDLDRLE